MARGRRAPAVRVGVELGPLLPADRRHGRAELRGLDHARRDRHRDAADQDRLPGHRHDLPAPGRAGQHGRHRGHHVRRPPRARHRRGLEPDGVRRLRHRAAAAEGALRPVRRGRRVDGDAAHRAGVQLPRPVRPAHRRALRAQAGAAPAPADHHRRHRPSAHAAHDRPVGAASGTPSPAAGSPNGSSSRTCSRGHCAAIGRDVSEITCSVNVRGTKTTSTRWSRTRRPGGTRAWTCASSASRCTSSQSSSRRWPRHSPRSAA